jgi:hypothetical protein
LMLTGLVGPNQGQQIQSQGLAGRHLLGADSLRPV